jgi:hypothetical protein
MQHHSPASETETLYHNKVVQLTLREWLGWRFGGAEPQLRLPRKFSGVGCGQSGGLVGGV